MCALINPLHFLSEGSSVSFNEESALEASAADAAFKNKENADDGKDETGIHAFMHVVKA